MIWQLVICIGVTAMGCGDTHISKMPDKMTCFEALKEMRVNRNEGDRSVVAYCRPAPNWR